MTLYSFRVLNPDWKIDLYVAKSEVKQSTWSGAVRQDFATYYGKDYLKEVEAIGVNIIPWTLLDEEFPNMCASHKSNFFKWHLLGTNSGIYADLDILWVRPFDAFFEQARDKDIVICHTKYLSIGLLASVGNSAFFYDVFHHGKSHYDPGSYQSCGVENVYTMLYGESAWIDGRINWERIAQKNILDDIARIYNNPTIFNIPMNCVYPILPENLDLAFDKGMDLDRESIGLHWYAGHPIAQKYNGILNETNYTEVDNTFCRYARALQSLGANR